MKKLITFPHFFKQNLMDKAGAEAKHSVSFLPESPNFNLYLIQY